MAGHTELGDIIAEFDRRAQGRQIHLAPADPADPETEVLTSMCARLYGRRSAARRAERALAAAV